MDSFSARHNIIINYCVSLNVLFWYQKVQAKRFLGCNFGNIVCKNSKDGVRLALLSLLGGKVS